MSTKPDEPVPWFCRLIGHGWRRARWGGGWTRTVCRFCRVETPDMVPDPAVAIAYAEHNTLESRSWEEWGHGAECFLCIRARWEDGATTAADFAAADPGRTLFVAPSTTWNGPATKPAPKG